MAEALGTGLLLSMVVGSGIMAERLSQGNVAIALLANSLATGAGLVALILALGSVSAHFNPAVTLAAAEARTLAWRDVPLYIGAQAAGGVAGVATAHFMFGLPLVTASQHDRSGLPQVAGEFVATFGLVLVIAGCGRSRTASVPYAVGAFIASAYWFTSSTSFANPVVTVARALSDTFAGIRPADVPAFIVAQLLGASAAVLVARLLFPRSMPEVAP
jgi:glycerol uptake facilitator-like aquaporin